MGSQLRFLGADGPATQATIGRPGGLAFDSAGNLYIADTAHHMVLKVTPGGVLTVFAGTGEAAFSGDGGPATGAALNFPWGLDFDSAGNLYVGDTLNGRVRRITPAGTITTAAVLVPSGWGLDVAVDSRDNLYFSQGQKLLRRTSAGIQETVFDTGRGDSVIRGIAVDRRSGNVYVTNTITEVTRLAPDGTSAVAAHVASPSDLAFDSNGNLYVSDGYYNRVFRLSAAGELVVVAGTGIVERPTSAFYGPWFSGDGGPATAAQLFGPAGLAVDRAGNVYVSDSNNNRVRRVSTTGQISTFAGTGEHKAYGDTGPAAAASLNQPLDVTFDRDGNLLVADFQNLRVRKITPSGVITTVAGNGSSGGGGDRGPATAASLAPVRVAAAPDGNVYLVDNSNPFLPALRKLWPNGEISTIMNAGAVAVTAAGDVYVAFAGPSGFEVDRIERSGALTRVAGGRDPAGIPVTDGPALQIPLNPILDMEFASDGTLYMLEVGLYVRKLTRDGNVVTVAGGVAINEVADGARATEGRLRNVGGIAVDQQGNLYIAQRGDPIGCLPCGTGPFMNERVRKVSPDGIISTVAGSITRGFAGDGGAATSALMNAPAGLAIDRRGNLIIADSFNDRIRKVLFAPPSLPQDSIVSAASLQAVSAGGQIAPGSLVAVFGLDLAASSGGAARLPLPAELQGTSVTFNGIAAPLVYVSPGQLNAQLPFELAPGEVTVRVVRDGQPSEVRSVRISAVAPAIFSMNQQGTGQGAVLHLNGKVVDQATPARRGDVVQVFCTGLGATSPALPSGSAAPPDTLIRTSVAAQASVAGQPARVLFSGLAPGFAGLYQVNVEIPSTAPAGNAVPLSINAGGVVSNTVTIAVMN